MPCEFISASRLEPCKDQVGGLRAVYFIDFEDPNLDISFDTDGDAITNIGDSATNVIAYKYDLRGTSSFTQNIAGSRDDGTTTVEQVLELSLKKLTQTDHNQLKLLMFNRPHVIVEDNNGNYQLAGLEYGCDVTGGTVVTGSNMSEFTGYTITLTGMEKKPANWVVVNTDLAGINVDVQAATTP